MKTIYTHFQEPYRQVQNQIKDIDKEIGIYKKYLNSSNLTEEIINKNMKMIDELKEKIKELKQSDVYSNRDVSDIEHLLDIFEIDIEKYNILNKKIGEIIRLVYIMHNKVVTTSEENKQEDKQKYTDNEIAKRRFVKNYKVNEVDCLNSLLFKAANNLQNQNRRAKEKVKIIEKNIDDKELQKAYILCETLLSKNPTALDIKRDIDFLIEKKIRNIIKQKHIEHLANYMEQEVMLRIKNGKKKDLDIEKKLMDLKISYYTNELKKVKSENLSAAAAWERIL